MAPEAWDTSRSFSAEVAQVTCSGIAARFSQTGRCRLQNRRARAARARANGQKLAWRADPHAPPRVLVHQHASSPPARPHRLCARSLHVLALCRLPLPNQQRAEAVLQHPSKLLYLLRPESAASRLLSSAFSCESYAVLEE